jgi:predicted dehydrogenase
MVGHTFLYSAPILRAREYIASGELGTIRYATTQRLNLGLFQRDINVVWDLAPHDLSVLQFLFGEEADEVSAHGAAHVVPEVEDVALVSLRFPSRRVAFVHVSWLDPLKVRRITIVGDRKMLVYDDLDPQGKVRIFNKGVDGPRHYDNFGEFHFAYRYGDVVTPYIQESEPLRALCQDFLDSIRLGRAPRSDGRAGLAVVRALEAAERSLRHRGAWEDIHAGNGRNARVQLERRDRDPSGRDDRRRSDAPPSPYPRLSPAWEEPGRVAARPRSQGDA